MKKINKNTLLNISLHLRILSNLILVLSLLAFGSFLFLLVFNGRKLVTELF